MDPSASHAGLENAARLVRRCEALIAAQEMRLSILIKRNQWRQVELAWDLLQAMRHALAVARDHCERLHTRPSYRPLSPHPHRRPERVWHPALVDDGPGRAMADNDSPAPPLAYPAEQIRVVARDC
jgi:hypothetical protein